MEFVERVFEYGVPVHMVEDIKWGDSKRFSVRTNEGRVLGPRKLKNSSILGVSPSERVVVTHHPIEVKTLDFVHFRGEMGLTVSNVLKHDFDVLKLGGAVCTRGSSTAYVDFMPWAYEFKDNMMISKDGSGKKCYMSIWRAIADVCANAHVFAFNYDVLIFRSSWNKQLRFSLDHTPKANAFFAKVALDLARDI